MKNWVAGALIIAACATLSVQQQLEREYATITEGFKRDDPTAWINHLTPDFRLTLFNGAVQDRNWVINYVTNNAKSFHIEQLTMTIKKLERHDDQTIATVEQKSSRTFTDAAGPHRLDVGAIQLETWQRTPTGWKLKAVQEKDVLYIRKDGQPPTP